MRRVRTAVAVAILSVALAVVPMQSRAFAPVVAIAGWLLEVTGGSILISDLVAGQVGIIAAALWYDCNKFSMSNVCTNKPASMPQTAAPSPGLTVKLAPDAKRINPDLSKFDDSREAKPKSAIPATAQSGGSSGGGGADTFFWGGTFDGKLVTGGSAAEVLKTIAAYSDCKQFTPCTYSGLTRVDYAVVKTDNVGTTANGSSCPKYNGYSGGFYYTNGSNTWPRSASAYGAPCTPSNINPSNAAYQVPNPTTYLCPNGYTLSGTTCNLTDPTQVQKPDGTPCEVLYYADSKSMKTDPQNVSGCANVPSTNAGGALQMQQNDGSGNSMTITPNSDGGFDITQTKGNGQSTTVHTGSYDPVGGGYHITSTSTSVPSGQTPDGQGDGCGIAGKPACSVNLSSDSTMDGANTTAQGNITSGNNTLKGALDGIDSDSFKWTFIPQIPTASCTNPRVKNPVISQWLDVDICGGFNKFSFFLNAVLAVLCVYGCVRQVQNAMKA